MLKVYTPERWFSCSSNTTNTSLLKRWYRFLSRRCMDCGAKLHKPSNRGDVCVECYDDFDGMTLDELCR